MPEKLLDVRPTKIDLRTIDFSETPPHNKFKVIVYYENVVADGDTEIYEVTPPFLMTDVPDGPAARKEDWRPEDEDPCGEDELFIVATTARTLGNVFIEVEGASRLRLARGRGAGAHWITLPSFHGVKFPRFLVGARLGCLFCRN